MRDLERVRSLAAISLWKNSIWCASLMEPRPFVQNDCTKKETCINNILKLKHSLKIENTCNVAAFKSLFKG